MEEDYCDISNVDGYTIGMSIESIEETFKKIENPEDAEKK